MYSLGFDIGGSFVKAALVDDAGAISARLTRPFSFGLNQQELVQLLRGMAAELNPQGAEIAGVGVAAPGSFDQEERVVLHAHNLGWHDYPLAEAVAQAFPNISQRTLNDANAAAWAEHRAGALRGCECGLLLTLGTGVGCGLIINGQLFNGGRNSGCEGGHLLLGYPQGEQCTCGQRGCLETSSSAPALLRLAASAGWAGEGTEQLISQAQQGDALACGIWDEYLDGLAAGLASLVNLLDPQIIALGGGLAAAGELLFAPLQQLTAEKCFFADCGPIVPAQLGNWAGAIGAGLLAQE